MLPKSEHKASDVGVCVVEMVIAHSSPAVVVVHFKTSSIARSVLTRQSHLH